MSIRVRAAERSARPAAQAIALVTAESSNRVFGVTLRSGRVADRVIAPADPESLAVSGGVAAVVSSRASEVSLLSTRSLRRLRVIRGFLSPHIVEIAPGDQYAYVTDDARGTVTVIRLPDGAVTDRLTVGAGAHHLGFSPDGSRLWLALGETARTVVVLDTTTVARPRVIGRFDPGSAVHDLAFSPDGRRVWVTSADRPYVSVFDPLSRRLLFRVQVGPAPQHVAIEGGFSYLTSGYGRVLEKVDADTGTVLAKTSTPYGSFELDARGHWVVTSSLLRGTVAVFDSRLRLLHLLHVAAAARDVAIGLG